jgi:hypothetical protein
MVPALEEPGYFLLLIQIVMPPYGKGKVKNFTFAGMM